MTCPSWLRDAWPTEWLNGRADALLAYNDPHQRGYHSVAWAEARCRDLVVPSPDQAAWWAGYAQAIHEQETRR